jgi:hypothetical protein
MATDLSIRLYFSAPSSIERFEALVEALEDSPLANHTWHGFRVATRRPLQYRVHRDDRMTAAQVREAAREAGLGIDEDLGSYTSLRCWRRDDDGMVEGSVVAYLNVYGDEYIRMNEEDPRMAGQAAITLSHAAPFVVDITGQDATYNEKVEQNLDNLTGLMVDLANALQPDALRLFTDQGLYLPFNSHLSFFRRAEIVLEDIELLRQVWKHGLPLHRVPPLHSYTGGVQNGALHLDRTPAQRHELWQRLTAGLGHTPTVDDVHAILTSGRFDTLTKGEGFVVLEYPHFVNSFVARFYLEVLEHAGRR